MKALLLCLLTCLLLPLSAAAHEVLVVQSVRSTIYDDALKGFRSACPADTRTLVLSDYADPELSRVINEERPRLLVAVGDGALASLHKFGRLPVLALMALGLHGAEQEPANVSGVTLYVKPEQYLSVFRKLRTRRVGVVYDPSRTGWYLKMAHAAARQHGVELVLREVSDPRQTVAQLATLRGEVDALWLVPDTTAVTRETLEAFLLFAQGQSIPVVTFSTAHLRLGALLAVEADRVEMGRQAGEMARELLHRGHPEQQVASPRKVAVHENEAVARRLKYPADLAGPLSRK